MYAYVTYTHMCIWIVYKYYIYIYGPMDLMPVRFYGGFEDLTEGAQLHVFLSKNQLIGNSSS